MRADINFCWLQVSDITVVVERDIDNIKKVSMVDISYIQKEFFALFVEDD